jgi:hypothetical protein
MPRQARDEEGTLAGVCTSLDRATCTLQRSITQQFRQNRPRKFSSDELVRRLPKLPTEQLIACFEDWEICGAGEGMASGWPISDELARRGNLDELLVRYWWLSIDRHLTTAS